MASIAYLRISTADQDVASQRLRILQTANDAGVHIDQWVEETASGVAMDRAVFDLVESLQPGDQLVTTELSRLGRSLRMVNDLISKVREKGASIWVLNNNLHLGNGQLSVADEALIFALSIGAQVERDLLRERVRHGIFAAKAAGVKLGRKPGISKLDAHSDEIEKLVEAKVGKAAIARILRCSRTTVDMWLRRHGQN